MFPVSSPLLFLPWKTLGRWPLDCQVLTVACWLLWVSEESMVGWLNAPVTAPASTFGMSLKLYTWQIHDTFILQWIRQVVCKFTVCICWSSNLSICKADYSNLDRPLQRSTQDWIYSFLSTLFFHVEIHLQELKQPAHKACQSSNSWMHLNFLGRCFRTPLFCFPLLLSPII